MLSCNAEATTGAYTLSLHDALPISAGVVGWRYWLTSREASQLDDEISRAQSETSRLHGIIQQVQAFEQQDRKSTRLNSSHLGISYAVFCLKKKTYTCASDSPNGACV